MSDDIKNLGASLAEFMANTRIEGEIAFPVEVSGVRNMPPRPRKMTNVGAWVAVRLVGDDNRTYLGVHLGDQMRGQSYSYNVVTKEVTVYSLQNPAIYVPDLKRVVWGAESWWSVIVAPDQLRAITDADIEGQWYVQALRDMDTKADATEAAVQA